MVMVNLTMPGNETKCSSCQGGFQKLSESRLINGFCGKCCGKSFLNNSSNNQPVNNATTNGDDETEDSDHVDVIINTGENTNKIKSLDALWDKISMLMNKNANAVEKKISALSTKIDFTISCMASVDRKINELTERIQSIEEELYESEDLNEEDGEDGVDHGMEPVMEDVMESVMESEMEPVMEPVMENVHDLYEHEVHEEESDELGYVLETYDPIIDHNSVVTDADLGYAPSPYEQQAPVPAQGQPVMQMPPPGAQPTPGYAPHTHAPPPFLVPPPQFIASQTAPPSIINYVAGPNGPIFQPNYQSYNPAAVQVNLEPGPPPQEVPLFQPQGCTYYNPQQQQQQQQQSVPLRRPKAAIPILPPPENQNSRSRNRQQSQSHQDQQQHEQMIQQQQQQEQLVQQQLQQHQQQLIQQQQQELQQQQEKLIQQQQMMQQQSDVTRVGEETTIHTELGNSSNRMTDTKIDLDEKLNKLSIDDQMKQANFSQISEPTSVETKVEKNETSLKVEVSTPDNSEQKLEKLDGLMMNANQETSEISSVIGDRSELDCSVKESAVIHETAA